MKRILSLALACTLFASCTMIAKAEAAEENCKIYYVATDGSDENDGSKENPFATITGARDAIRAIKDKSAYDKICVYLRGGDYASEKLTFTTADSGTVSCEIVYRNYPGETVTLYNGYQLLVKDFKKVSDQKVLSRLYDEKAREFLYQYDLSEIKGLKIASKGTNVMTCDGVLMNIARFPNVDENGKSVNIKVNELVSQTNSYGGFSFTLPDAYSERTRFWSTADAEGGATVLGTTNTAWYMETLPLGNITKGVLHTSKAMAYPSNGWQPMQSSIYVENILAELDVPGEYYIDDEKELLYFFPPADSTENSPIFISESNSIFWDIAASYVRISGINMNGMTGQAVNITGKNVTLEYSTIENLGGTAVMIQRAARNCTVDGCYVRNVCGGIQCAAGDLNTLDSGNCYITNNHVENFARKGQTYQTAVEVQGVDNVASNNLIHGAKHMAIGCHEIGNKFIFNEIYDVCNDTEDAGAMYHGRHATDWGNELSNNYFHDIKVNEKYVHGSFGIRCVYYDDYQYGYTTDNNLMVDVDGLGIVINGGSYHTANNNIGINLKSSVVNAGAGPRSGDRFLEFIEKNATAGSMLAQMWNNYQSSPVDVFATRYPEANQLEGSQLLNPKGNEVNNNLAYNCGGGVTSIFVQDDTPVASSSGNIDGFDPYDLFVDFDNKDYRINPNSKVFTQSPGFRDIQFEKMGLYKNMERIDNSIAVSVNNAGAYVNGEFELIDEGNLNVTPVIVSNRTMIPVRFISESLGADVQWDAATRTVTVTLNGKIITMKIGESLINIDGTAKAIDAPAMIIDNRTMLPMRALTEALGKSVYWNDAGLVVIGNTSDTFNSEEQYMVDDLINRMNVM